MRAILWVALFLLLEWCVRKVRVWWQQPSFSGVRKPWGPYEELGVSEGASWEEIKQAYQHLAKRYHPDTLHHMPLKVRAQAEERMKKINAAYAVLKKRGVG
jgi:DnaJ-class molecular chaperone